jgi:hypothetical protein
MRAFIAELGPVGLIVALSLVVIGAVTGSRWLRARRERLRWTGRRNGK